MTMVQMNVRIDAKLKNEVEEVLKGKGVSVSDVIRSLWLYIADRKEVPALETTAEEQAREEEKQRKLKLIREGAGYVHKELVKAGLISEDTDLMEGLTYKQFRDEIADERLKDVFYITPERFKERFMNDESMVVATTAKLILPEVAWSGISKLKELMTIVPIGAEECELAQSLRHAHNDFEDDLIIAAAQQSGATYVVTYDKKLAKHFPEYCKTPAEIVAALA